MGTMQQRRPELDLAVERERQAFERRLAAFLKVKQTFVEHGNGPATHERLGEADAADGMWRVAKAEVGRLKQTLPSHRGAGQEPLATSARSDLIGSGRPARIFQRLRRPAP